VKSLVDVARALIASAKSRSGNGEGNEVGGDTQEGLKEVGIDLGWSPLLTGFVKQYMKIFFQQLDNEKISASCIKEPEKDKNWHQCFSPDCTDGPLSHQLVNKSIMNGYLTCVSRSPVCSPQL